MFGTPAATIRLLTWVEKQWSTSFGPPLSLNRNSPKTWTCALTLVQTLTTFLNSLDNYIYCQVIDLINLDLSVIMALTSSRWKWIPLLGRWVIWMGWIHMHWAGSQFKTVAANSDEDYCAKQLTNQLQPIKELARPVRKSSECSSTQYIPLLTGLYNTN
jgi:hypothetical protein